ncbi:MAG: winged helix-turn-helix transcriptional regulator [Planctomycetes bacterium]|nr:winged helix-turn-helix transcriptional regulator [Planctomycetota bacterium]
MKALIDFGKLVSDPTRVKIIKLLSTQSMCVCELMDILKINQSCVSQHLAILKNHNLIDSRREGKWIVYGIRRKALNGYLKETASFFKKTLGKPPSFKTEYQRLAGLKNRGLLCLRLKCCKGENE